MTFMTDDEGVKLEVLQEGDGKISQKEKIKLQVYFE